MKKGEIKPDSIICGNRLDKLLSATEIIDFITSTKNRNTLSILEAWRDCFVNNNIPFAITYENGKTVLWKEMKKKPC